MSTSTTKNPGNGGAPWASPLGGLNDCQVAWNGPRGLSVGFLATYTSGDPPTLGCPPWGMRPNTNRLLPTGRLSSACTSEYSVRPTASAFIDPGGAAFEDAPDDDFFDDDPQEASTIAATRTTRARRTAREGSVMAA